MNHEQLDFSNSEDLLEALGSDGLKGHHSLKENPSRRSKDIPGSSGGKGQRIKKLNPESDAL